MQNSKIRRLEEALLQKETEFDFYVKEEKFRVSFMKNFKFST